MDFGGAGPSVPGPYPNLPLVDLLWWQWEQELSEMMGGGQQDNEGILSFLCGLGVPEQHMCGVVGSAREADVIRKKTYERHLERAYECLNVR